MNRHILHIPILAAVLLVSIRASAQILPDRATTLDPLGRSLPDTVGFSWLPSTDFYAEFGRYSNGSGTNHRWNAKTGGFIEFVRLDSTWSLAAVGTMEVVIDPLSDIQFSPRAIFWEEGLVTSARLGENSALQVGYIHRCKHDIDNLDKLLLEGKQE